MAEELLPTVAGPQTEAAVTPTEAPPVTPRVLDDDQRALLAAILNRLIPARDALPGAGDLGVAGSIERTLAVSPPLRRLFADGLVTIQLTAARRSDRPFQDLDGAHQDAVLRDVETVHPTFFAALVEHAYRGYYPLRAVREAVDFPTHPPQPRGHQLPQFDPSLLEKQRQREPFWRRTESGT
jgi:hypothetical protein